MHNEGLQVLEQKEGTLMADIHIYGVVDILQDEEYIVKGARNKIVGTGQLGILTFLNHFNIQTSGYGANVYRYMMPLYGWTIYTGTDTTTKTTANTTKLTTPVSTDFNLLQSKNCIYTTNGTNRVITLSGSWNPGDIQGKIGELGLYMSFSGRTEWNLGGINLNKDPIDGTFTHTNYNSTTTPKMFARLSVADNEFPTAIATGFTPDPSKPLTVNWSIIIGFA